ncbi:DUF6443 domain-containing protein [Chryseobacterium sp. c4a]|uniref:DUF6443 domain-containing protein n=1 Tax=Chryseobacterium sp. c4a TaxID=1573582 RepID=UPI0013583853|nr:DUF6443 domain-containing protein [Chryseobacterium sp. c4a]
MTKILQFIVWLLGISLWPSQISLNTVVTEQNKVITAPTSIRFLSGFRVTASNVGTFHAYLSPNQGGGTVTPIDPTPSTGMSPGENYILATQCLDANCTKKTETIQYFDGLGRPKQVINIKASPTGKDIVTPIIYDQFGRQTRDYLPIPQQSSSNGTIYNQNYSLVDFPVGDPTGVFTGEKAFSEKILENSPLDRIFEEKQVGNAWSSKPIKYDYDANATGEVKKYVTTTTWSNGSSNSAISQTGTYNAGVLYKNIVTDEDGNKTVEFKNGQGQTILVRKELNTSQTADTYYVYNEYNQLAYVIPPLASVTDEATLNNLCYQYRYDGQKRLVEKKIPGKDWEYMVYDKADRLVLTQDANLRTQGKWFFTKYDIFSRPIYTGILDSPAGRNQQVTAVEAAGLNIESQTTSSWNNSGMDVFYSNTDAYPTTNFKVLSINYYDTYPAGSPAFPNTFAQNLLTDSQNTKSTKSLPVASFIKNIEDDNWTRDFIWYNTQGKIIGTHSVNHLNGYTKTETDLDFTGIPKKTITSHKRLSSDAEKIITETFEYDHQNRIKKHWHQINSQPQELLAENTYNEKSELTNKKTGNNLQSIDYLYNIRGWLTFINDPYALSGKLFGYAIKYQNPEYSNIVPAKYNGNISEIDWKTANDGIQRRYNYSYDSLSRLSAGIYTEPSSSIIENNYYNELMTYDLNGNIKTLARYSRPSFGATAEQIDNLIYNYKNGGLSNQLERVTLPGGIANNPSGYNALQNAISYDANGNMKDLLDKGISNISYNFLNIPNNITSSIGNTSYIYSASGQKLKKVFGSKTVDYLNGFQYENNILQFIPTSEGYFDLTKNQYIYNYTDHLGNVRLSYTKGASGGAEIIEENNYYPFGLKHERYNSSSLLNTSYQYRYNGKELQETGMYDYGARQYMADLGRWFVLDERTEKYRSWTPYNYAINNPIKYVDPDGKDILNVTGGVQFTGQDAQTMFAYLQQNMSSSGRSHIKGFHFVMESTTPNIYRHTLDSFRKGKQNVLHYDSDRTRSRKRRTEATSGYPTKPGFDRDEYPYASTFEGGKGANIAYVPSEENRIGQGLLALAPLYRKLKTGDAFMVIPVPKNREPEDVKQEALESSPKQIPIPRFPDVSHPTVPMKFWPVMGAAGILIFVTYFGTRVAI